MKVRVLKLAQEGSAGRESVDAANVVIESVESWRADEDRLACDGNRGPKISKELIDWAFQSGYHGAAVIGRIKQEHNAAVGEAIRVTAGSADSCQTAADGNGGTKAVVGNGGIEIELGRFGSRQAVQKDG